MLTNGILVVYSPDKNAVEAFELEDGDLPDYRCFVQRIPISESSALEWEQVLS